MQMRTVIYLHGFLSSPKARKAEIIRQALEGKARFFAPDLNVPPMQVQDILKETVRDIDPARMTVIGASLGGFYADWLASRYQSRALLINPTVAPDRKIAAFLGQYVLPDGRQLLVRDSYAAQLKAMTVPRDAVADDLLCLLTQGDEVLDYREAAQRYAHRTVRIVPESDHTVSEFDRLWPGLETFVLGDN